MEEKFILPNQFKRITYILSAIGVITLVAGFLLDPKRTWVNYLLVNYYFVSLAIGASFFFAVQYVAQAGWSSVFKRIPEAMMAYLPFAAVFFLLLVFGMKNIFEWTHEEVIQHDHLLQHKSPYLNEPFFFIRVIVFFGAWILLTRLLRKFSLLEDEQAGMEYFRKSEFYSKIFIFVVALSFSLFAVDMLLSLEPHWFSTIFAARSFIAAFMHGSSVIALIAIWLNANGHFKMLNKSHLHDFTRYIFMASIVWGYFNFAEFMLIWYGNIPEETVYFAKRWDGIYLILFFVAFAINWLIPFLVLMPKSTSRNGKVIVPVIILLFIGQYIELYYHIWPATMESPKFGLIEIGIFIGYLGFFAWVVANRLTKANLVPKNHPYLEESLYHHF